MRGPLIERFPPGAPELARFDAAVGAAEHRRALTTDYDSASEERYARGVRRYTEWCREVGYQPEPDPARPDQMAERLLAFTVWGITEKRYAVSTLWTHIHGVKLYMQRHGVEVGDDLAMSAVEQYRDELADHGEGKRPTRRRRRRSA